MTNFIKEQLKSGTSQENITTALMTNGWTENDIKEGFEKATGKISMKNMILYTLVGVIFILGIGGYYFREDIKSSSLVKDMLLVVGIGEEYPVLVENELAGDFLLAEKNTESAVSSSELSDSELSEKSAPAEKKEGEKPQVEKKTTGLPGTMTFTSKTHKFSFAHLDTYLNFSEGYLLEMKKNNNLGEKMEEACRKKEDPALSYEECIAQMERMKEVYLYIASEFEEQLKGPTDMDGDDEFSYYKVDDFSRMDESFRYFVRSLNEKIFIPSGSQGEWVTIKLSEHQEAGFRPNLYYVYKDGGISQVEDATLDMQSMGEEGRRLNPHVVPMKYTPLKPVATSEAGVPFYKINQGKTQSHLNLYCAVGGKVVCFDTENLLSFEDRMKGKNDVALEKKVMDPIMKTFKFLK